MTEVTNSYLPSQGRGQAARSPRQPSACGFALTGCPLWTILEPAGVLPRPQTLLGQSAPAYGERCVRRGVVQSRRSLRSAHATRLRIGHPPPRRMSRHRGRRGSGFAGGQRLPLSPGPPGILPFFNGQTNPSFFLLHPPRFHARRPFPAAAQGPRFRALLRGLPTFADGGFQASRPAGQRCLSVGRAVGALLFRRILE